MEYKVEIIDRIFDETFLEKRYGYYVKDYELCLSKKTAIVTCCENEKIVRVLEYGVVDKEEIYKLIDEGREINLNFCYVKDLSLREFKEKYISSRMGIVDYKVSIKKMCANTAFFDSSLNECIDFNSTEFKGFVNFMGTIFKGKVQFSGVRFKGNVEFEDASFKGEVNFIQTEFEGHASFQYVKFDHAVFNDSKFKEGADFFGAEFKGDTFFTGAIFEMNTDFACSAFEREVNFISTEFQADANIRNVKFGVGDVLFTGAEFQGDVDFSFTDFNEGDVIFDLAKFDGHVNFEHAKFAKGNLFFINTSMSILKFKYNVFNGYVDMAFTNCNRLDIVGCKIEKILDARWSREYPVKIKILKFLNTDNLGQIKLDWDKNNVKKMIYSQEDTNYYEKAEQFRLLKENFRNLGQYDDEDKAYVEFKRCEMKSKLYDYVEEPKKLTKKIQPLQTKIDYLLEALVFFIDVIVHKVKRVFTFIGYCIGILIFDKIGGYGTKPVNVIISMMITLIFFTGVYLFPNTLNYVESNYGKVGTAVYHSIVTFLTIGYGNVSPGNIMGVLASGIEGFLGLFLMSYFTVAYVRKILR